MVAALATVTALLFITSLAAGSQQAAQVARGGMARIGVLSPLMSAAAAIDISAFRRGMRELGYVEGRDVTIETRWTEGHPDRLQPLAAELVRLKMDVIVTNGDPAIRAVKAETRTIPIVVAIAGDLVAAGHAVSLARPGRQVTGFVDMAQDVGAKRVELLKEFVPTLTRVGVLWNVTSPLKVREFKETEAAVRALDLAFKSLEVRNAEDIATAFKVAARERVGAIVVLQEPLTTGHAVHIARLAAEARLPTIFGLRDSVDAGGLMGVRSESIRFLPPGRGLCRQDPEGGQAGRPPYPTADELRVDHQSEDGEGARPDDTAVSAAARRRGDRMSRRWRPNLTRRRTGARVAPSGR